MQPAADDVAEPAARQSKKSQFLQFKRRMVLSSASDPALGIADKGAKFMFSLLRWAYRKATDLVFSIRSGR